MAGRLYVVATPIGNLGDFSPRAIEVLRAVSLIACEDTRHSRVLLEKFGIGTPTTSLPAFAEGQRAQSVVDTLLLGRDVALISDAGTPAISDPGERLVSEALAAGIDVSPIPGPSAVAAALCASGLPTGRFYFLGFLPRQDSDADAMLDEVKSLSATLVLYESPRRLGDTLKRLLGVLGPRRAVVARELTKRFEEFKRGSLAVLADDYATREVLGEVVVLVEGFQGDIKWSLAEVTAALQQGLHAGERLKALSRELAQRSGWSANELYRRGLGLKDK